MAIRPAPARPNGLTVLLWVVPPLVELPGVVVMLAGFEEVARAAPLGATATGTALAVVLVVAVLAAVAAYRPHLFPTNARTVLGVTGAAAAAVTAALALTFLVRGTAAGVSILLAHSALSAAALSYMNLRTIPQPQKMAAKR